MYAKRSRLLAAAFQLSLYEDSVPSITSTASGVLSRFRTKFSSIPSPYAQFFPFMLVPPLSDSFLYLNNLFLFSYLHSNSPSALAVGLTSQLYYVVSNIRNGKFFSKFLKNEKKGQILLFYRFLKSLLCFSLFLLFSLPSKFIFCFLFLAQAFFLFFYLTRSRSNPSHMLRVTVEFFCFPFYNFKRNSSPHFGWLILHVIARV